MTRPLSSPAPILGFSMIEVLVSLMIIVLGLLGLAGLQARIQQSEFESYQRAQALILLQDMVDRVSQHRVTALCFRFTDDTSGTPYLGASGTWTPACSASTSNNNTQAVNTLTEWDNLLKGTAETKGGASVGAMVGARGCVSYAVGSELLDSTGATIPDTGLYTVAVAWQGTTDTAAPTRPDGTTLNCANGLYGTEARRRVVYMSFRQAFLK